MVNTSIFTGLAGLRSYQTYIDVIGSNLANVGTPGYRGSRVTFSDILSFTINPGSGPNGNLGGTNPKQIGLGSSVASIDVNTNQGTFQDTGRPMDVAIQGRGFFTLTDGLQTFYTRAGAFGIDNDRTLVDLRTGYRVIGASGGNITVPVSDTLPAQQTNSVTFTGSLPATVTGPLEEIVQSSSPFLAGVAAQNTATPPAGTTYDLSSFLGGSLLVRVNNNSQQRIDIPTSFASPSNAVTAAEVAALFSSMSNELQVTANGGTGAIDFSTVQLGTGATLKFDDGQGSVGLLTALGLTPTQAAGSQTPAGLTTDLANMTMRLQPYASGDQVRIEGTNPDGSPFSSTFIYGAGNNGTTVGDLVNFINGLADSAQGAVTLDVNGNLTFTSVNKDAADMSLNIGDLSSTSKNAWPSMSLVQDGAGPDQAFASIDVVDSLGRPHAVDFTFTRSATDSSVWDLSASLDPTEGTITSNTVSSIRFNADGSFNVIGGGTNSFDFSFNGIATSQSISVNLGSSGQFDGVTMLGSATTVAATDQDGFGPGSLLNIAFDSAGAMQGFYSNGQSQVIDSLRISVFPNDAGLLRAGDSMFVESPNSDTPITTTAGGALAGTIRSGSLENSNIDIAEEFVNLITAQRGFQANSRVITTTDEILAEIVNIVR